VDSVGGVRTLTLRELNRATLARQLLLQRRRASTAAVIERLAGMQAQWAPAPYVGLWTRIDGFRRESLERLVRRGEVLKPTVMRGTLHLVTARDYPVFFAALRDYRWWSDATSTPIGEAAAVGIRELYAEPLPARAGDEYLERSHGVADELTRRRAWHVARIQAHVLHAPDTALWKVKPRVSFTAVPEPDAVDVTAARAELVRRYLAAFGPASRADIAAWSGMPVRDFAPALETLEPLRRFQDERGRELLDLPRMPLPDPDTPAPVRFLPKWDNVLLGFADRTRVLPEEYRKSVIIKNGDVAQTFLVDGVVAGAWRVERGRVAIEPLAPLPRAARRAVDDEAAKLAGFLG
jgi:Winged helix DNA-binding domain